MKRVLETERLILEELTENHFDNLRELLSNKRVHRHFKKTLNEQESREFLESIQLQYIQSGYSFWAVKRKSDSIFLGICGLLKQEIDDIEEIEVGYRINDRYWGSGYGTEAARGCLEYARETLKCESVISLIREENTQSIRVAEKNGLQFEKNTVFCELPHKVYRIKLN